MTTQATRALRVVLCVGASVLGACNTTARSADRRDAATAQTTVDEPDGGATIAQPDAGVADSRGRGEPGGLDAQPAVDGQSRQPDAIGGPDSARITAAPCADHPYCNDFESVAVGARPPGGVMLTAGNKLSVVDTKAFSGKKSLFIEAAQATAWVNLGVHMPDPKRRVSYLRMMLWMENLPGGDGHWSVLRMSGPVDAGALGTYSGFVSFGGSTADTRSRLLYGGAGADCDKASPPPVPTRRWVCVEMKVDDTAPLQYGARLDGVEVPGLSFARNSVGHACFRPGTPGGVWYVPAMDTLGYGFQYFHNQGRPVRMWIDDVVADQKPIGCP